MQFALVWGADPRIECEPAIEMTIMAS